MKLEIFTLADGYRKEPSGKTTITGIVDSFYAPSLPARAELINVVLKVRADESDNGRDHTIDVRLIDPHAAHILRHTQVVQPNVPRGETASFDYAIELKDFPFHLDGQYFFHVTIDGVEAAGRFPLRVTTKRPETVVEGIPPAAEGPPPVFESEEITLRRDASTLPSGRRVEFEMETFFDEAPLYKYLLPVHALAMLERGQIRIGTLSEFRRSYDREGRSDPGEGVRQLQGWFPDGPFTSNDDVPPFFRGLIEDPVRGARIHVKNTLVLRTVRAPDGYVYCTSFEFEDEALYELGGACVRIDKPRAFFEALTDALGDRVESPVVVQRVSYEPRNGPHDQVRLNVAPHFVKPQVWHFARQFEVRAFWRPCAIAPAEPVIIDVPGIIDLVSPHVLPRGRTIVK
jgi:hypothetical protein